MKNGARGEPKGTPKSRNFGVFSRLLSRTPQKMQNGPNMTPKWSQHGVKMGSKRSQNGAKNEWTTSEKSSRNICVFWEFLTGFQTCFQWYHQTFCMKSVRHVAEFPENFHWNSWRSPTELVGKYCGNRQGIHWNYWGTSADIAGNSYCLSGDLYGIQRELAGGHTAEFVWK